MIILNIAKDFSKYPAGRTREEGPKSGEAFREDFLIPSLKQYGKIKIELDGVEGYGSSFLEEAFGGVVRKKIYDAETLKNKIILDSKDDELISEIKEYIDDAQKE